MNALMKPAHGPLTMSSQEISDLVESRHDNVKRTVERLAERGTIQLPPLEEVKNQQGQTVSVYQLCKRDSYVVVAQLSPEFTARLVDRWQELESGAAPVLNMRDPRQMAMAALQLIEVNQELQATIEEQQRKIADDAPKVQALIRFSDLEGKHNLRNSSKLIGLQESKLKAWLLINRWYYRDHGGRLCAHADKIKAGLLDTVPVEIMRSEGVQVVQQPVILQKGLTKLAELLVKDGLLPRGTS